MDVTLDAEERLGCVSAVTAGAPSLRPDSQNQSDTLTRVALQQLLRGRRKSKIFCNIGSFPANRLLPGLLRGESATLLLLGEFVEHEFSRQVGSFQFRFKSYS